MKLPKNIRGNAVAALDFGAEAVTVVLAEKTEAGLRVAATGRADSSGVRGGEVVHVGDAAESVAEALAAAERQAGFTVDEIHYNFDDPGMRSVKIAGSKVLAGEGEIAASDVADACRSAERMAEEFDRRIVYSRPVAYLIDDRDAVPDPVGAFGRKLDVTLHVLLARAEHWEAWQSVLRRALVGTAIAHPTALSIATAVLPEGAKGTRVVADVGRDVVTVFACSGPVVSAYRTFAACERTGTAARLAAAVSEAAAEAGGAEELLLTGDLAEDEATLEAFASSGIATRRAYPQGVEGLSQASQAPVAGLLLAADRLHSRTALRPQKGLLSATRRKAAEFLNEYF